MELDSGRPRARRVMGAAGRIGVPAALTLLPLAVTLGALAVPASATAVGGRSAAVTAAAPGGGSGGMDVIIVATVAGPALAIGLLVAFRPRLARRRLIRRFRAEIQGCDLVGLWT